MANLPSAGEDDLRSYIMSNWNWIEIVDDGGNTVFRVDVTADSRFTMSSDSTTDPVQITGTITGSDSDVTLPVTIVGSELYKSSSDSNVRSDESFTQATLQSDNDEMNLTHNISID